jgi:hypothetical protein
MSAGSIEGLELDRTKAIRTSTSGKEPSQRFSHRNFFDWMLTTTRLPSWKHKAARTAQARQSSASGALFGEL